MKTACLIMGGVIVLHSSQASAQRGSTPFIDRKVTPLTLGTWIPLPEVYGRMDNFGWDTKRNLLIVSALANDTVEIIGDLPAGDDRSENFREPSWTGVDRRHRSNNGSGDEMENPRTHQCTCHGFGRTEPTAIHSLSAAWGFHRGGHPIRRCRRRLTLRTWRQRSLV